MICQAAYLYSLLHIVPTSSSTEQEKKMNKSKEVLDGEYLRQEWESFELWLSTLDERRWWWRLCGPAERTERGDEPENKPARTLWGLPRGPHGALRVLRGESLLRTLKLGQHKIWEIFNFIKTLKIWLKKVHDKVLHLMKCGQTLIQSAFKK